MNMINGLAFANSMGADPQAKSLEEWTRMGNKKTNFMIISDDVSTCLYVEILAHQGGVHARYFTEPSVALHAFENDPDHWSLVFVDMLSPLISKLFLVSKIRAIKPDTRVVILATHTPEQIRQAFESKSMCGLCQECDEAKNHHSFFLHKPFYREFDRVVETALGGKAIGLPA